MTGFQDDIRKVAASALPWAELEGSRILIVGATGLIGSCLVKILLSRKSANYQIYASGRDSFRALSLFQDCGSDPRFHFFTHDLLQPLNRNEDFHYIIHAASNASPNFFVSNPVEVMKSNLYGVANLLDYGKAHQMKRFLYVSSGEMYGQGDGRAFTEDYSGYVDHSSPRSCYPAAKRAAEVLCMAYAAEYGVDVTIARPCHIFGPYFSGNDNRVYAQFFRNLLNGEDIVLKSDGKQFRSWCYVVDCASALLYILLKGKSGEAYNIADENSIITIRELAERIAAINNKRVVIREASISEKKGNNPVTKSVFDTSKLRSLGWTIEDSLDIKLTHTYLEMLPR